MRREPRSEGVTPRSEEGQGAAAGAVGGVSPSLNDFLQVIYLSPWHSSPSLNGFLQVIYLSPWYGSPSLSGFLQVIYL